MTSHAEQIIKQRLEKREIVQSYRLYPQDPVTGEVALDITLNAHATPAANDEHYDSFTRSVSNALFDKINEAAHVTPSEVWLHDDTNAPQPIISFTFDAEDWAVASEHTGDINTLLHNITSPTKDRTNTYAADIIEQIKQRISESAQPINEAFFASLADEGVIAKKLNDLNMSHVKLQGYGYNSIVMTPQNNDDFVIRITAEDRQEMHHIPQVLNPIYRDKLADDFFIEVLPKIRTHGMKDEHKNALLHAVEAQGFTLEQDDIGLLPLVDGTQLPISYDTTNITRPNKHSEQWEWRNDNAQQPYDWASSSYADTMASFQEKFDTYERDSAIEADKNLSNAEKINSFAKAANETTHVEDVHTSRHTENNSDVIGF